MSTKQILFFCAIALGTALALAILLYPLAAMSPEEWSRAHTPQPAEDMPDVDVGKGFGTLPVIELMGYYIENPPPAPDSTTAAAPPRREKFGGC